MVLSDYSHNLDKYHKMEEGFTIMDEGLTMTEEALTSVEEECVQESKDNECTDKCLIDPFDEHTNKKLKRSLSDINI